MRITTMSRLWLGVAVAFVAASAVEAAPEPSPSAAYIAYVAAAQKATSLDELLPRLSKAYQAMLSAQPKEQKGVWLERLKEAASMTDIKIAKETIAGSKCTLEGTATSQRGMPLKGKVFLVKEDGGWKLDEEAWST